MIIKNKLYSSGQTITIAVGETYLLKNDEVSINNSVYKKKNLAIAFQNNGESIDNDKVHIGVINFENAINLPAHHEIYSKWSIDGVTPTSLSQCASLISDSLKNLGIISIAESSLGADNSGVYNQEERTDIAPKVFTANTYKEINWVLESGSVTIDVAGSSITYTDADTAIGFPFINNKGISEAITFTLGASSKVRIVTKAL